ncbi:hypothetical protein AB3Z07_13760 [Metabacillus halosaccharovorans]|uniref:hypothetical protein n=1 Tax=Metabacillus halosaccharovorans TaxID=930124 RepID=UPI0034CE6342
MIKKSYIEVDSQWGTLLRHQYSSSDSCLAVFFPGGDYPCDAPLLHYTRKASILAGCDTLSLAYGYKVVNDEFSFDKVGDLVIDCCNGIDQIISKYDCVIFVGKSIGTVIAGKIIDKFENKKISVFFMTPIPETIVCIKKSKGTVVVGTNDKYFLPENIEQVKQLPNIKTEIIPKATHSLEINDNYSESLAILNKVTDLCDSLVRELINEN